MDDEASRKDFLGVGWSFPISLDGATEIATVAHEQDIREAIRIILGTSPGERVMRPDFGAGLEKFVFAPLNATTMTLVRDCVEQALIQWEARIQLLKVDVTADAYAQNKLLICIDYRVRSTNTFYNLVYPFYLIEGERS